MSKKLLAKILKLSGHLEEQLILGTPEEVLISTNKSKTQKPPYKLTSSLPPIYLVTSLHKSLKQTQELTGKLVVRTGGSYQGETL